MGKNGIITLVVVAGGGYLAYWYMTNYGPTGSVMVNGVKVAPSYWDTWFGGVATTSTTPVTTNPVTGTVITSNPLPPASSANPLITAMAALPGYGNLSVGLKAEALALVSAAGAVSGPTANWFTIEASTGVPLTSTEQQAVISHVGQTTDVVSFVAAMNQVVNGAGGNPGSPPQNQPVNSGGGVSTNSLLSQAGVSSSTTMNADQWSYYYTQLKGGVALTAQQFSNAFPNLTSTDRGSMTADQFLSALSTAGLSGLGAQIRVPTRSYSGVMPGMSGMGMSFSSSPNRGFRSGGRGGRGIQ